MFEVSKSVFPRNQRNLIHGGKTETIQVHLILSNNKRRFLTGSFTRDRRTRFVIRGLLLNVEIRSATRLSCGTIRRISLTTFRYNLLQGTKEIRRALWKRSVRRPTRPF